MTELAERWTALCYLERKLIILNMQSEESERERERERGGVWRSVTYKWTAGCSCVNRQNRGMTEYKYTDSQTRHYCMRYSENTNIRGIVSMEMI